MTTEITEQSTAELSILDGFEVTKQQISEAVSLANEATVDGPEDKEGMKLCHDYRIGLKNMRISIEKKGKELREDALLRQRLVLKVTKDLTTPIRPAEARLQELEDTAKCEKERLDEIAKHECEVELNRRCKLATSIGWIIPSMSLQLLSQDEFDVAYGEKKSEHEAAEQAKAESAAKLKAEQDRVAKIAAEQKSREDELARKEAEQAAREKAIEDAERERRAKCLGWRTTCLAHVGASMTPDDTMAFSDDEFELHIAQLRIDYEQKKAEQAEAERVRKEQEAKELEDRIEAKAKEQAAHIEAERLANIQRENAKVEKAKAAAARKAARAPDIEKLKSYAKLVSDIPIPKFNDIAFHDAAEHALKLFTNRIADTVIEME